MGCLDLLLWLSRVKLEVFHSN